MKETRKVNKRKINLTTKESWIEFEINDIQFNQKDIQHIHGTRKLNEIHKIKGN